MNVPTNLPRTLALGLGMAAMALVALAPCSLRADDENHDSASLSDNVGDGLAKLDPLIKAKDWDGALTLVNGLMQQAAADSYDQAFLNETTAQIYTQKGDYLSAVTPLENAIAIADRHHYFSAKQEMDMLYFLSQLYYQKADATKGDHDGQMESFAKAVSYIERWIAISPKLTEDISTYYAQLLYAAAIADNPTHPDPERIKKAQVQIEKTLLTTVHPKDSLYLFLLATLQQQNNYERASEILELLLSHNPNNKTYWQDLDMFYMAMAQDPKEKDERRIRRFNIRAINTLERAQKLGFLTTQRDNYTLFTLYYNMGEYGIAADILHAGLSSGGIESNLANWTLLAASYQQINQDFKAVEALEEAASHFPTNGEIDFRVAQVYQSLDNNEQAYKHAQTAIEKGNLAKPAQTYIFVAYVAYELTKYDEAKAAIEKAIELTKKPDHQMLGLEAAIDEAIKERDAKKAADTQKAADKQAVDSPQA